MPSLLVTNDFPPKHGGIQSYLYELWRRLPPGDTTVLTTAFPDAASWDARQNFRIERVRERVLLPTPAVVRRIDALARLQSGLPHVVAAQKYRNYLPRYLWEPRRALWSLSGPASHGLQINRTGASPWRRNWTARWPS